MAPVPLVLFTLIRLHYLRSGDWDLDWTASTGHFSVCPTLQVQGPLDSVEVKSALHCFIVVACCFCLTLALGCSVFCSDQFSSKMSCKVDKVLLNFLPIRSSAGLTYVEGCGTVCHHSEKWVSPSVNILYLNCPLCIYWNLNGPWEAVWFTAAIGTNTQNKNSR